MSYWFEAECHYQSQIDTRPFIGNCCECDCELHGREYGGDEDIIYLMDNGNLVCSRCKTRQTSKTYILPSGITQTFRAGQVVEVSERDANFLLQYKYRSPQGEVKQVFEVV